ncbi:hypothetical protein J6590_020487 [Homalodisca vitripennis]|nr:hypothetical protein J6590_020487 [Homalodisca vitripennis]
MLRRSGTGGVERLGTREQISAARSRQISGSMLIGGNTTLPCDWEWEPPARGSRWDRFTTGHHQSLSARFIASLNMDIVSCPAPRR